MVQLCCVLPPEPASRRSGRRQKHVAAALVCDRTGAVHAAAHFDHIPLALSHASIASITTFKLDVSIIDGIVQNGY